MSEKFRIKITIAGRVYPISINNANEEEGMRIAAKRINDLVKKFEQNYAVKDKQDVLSMCALQFASKLEIDALHKKDTEVALEKKLTQLHKMIQNHL